MGRITGAFLTNGNAANVAEGQTLTPTLPMNHGNLAVPVPGEDLQDYINRAATPLQILQATSNIFFNAAMDRIREGERVSNGVSTLLRQGANVAATAARYAHSPQPVAIVNVTPGTDDGYESFLDSLANEPVEDAEVLEQLPAPT